MSYKRSGWGPLERGPNGRFCCRWCGAELPPDRQAYCDKDHYRLFMQHNDPQTQRRHVWLRDQGICQLCRRDCCERGYVSQYRTYFDNVPVPPPGDRLLKHLGVNEHWELDHIVPVVEGGGQCGLEGLRTLCIPCHRQVTRELRRRLSRSNNAAAIAASLEMQPTLPGLPDPRREESKRIGYT